MSEETVEEEEEVRSGGEGSGDTASTIQDLSSFDDKLCLLTNSMGYDGVVARNALEASDGDIEIAIEIIMGDETKQVQDQQRQSQARNSGASKNQEEQSQEEQEEFSHVGKTPKEVFDYYSRQLLGDTYHPQVRQHVKSGCKTIQSGWKVALNKWYEIDEQNQITNKTKTVINDCNTKLLELDEKHQWSTKMNVLASKANESAIQVLDTAKRSLEGNTTDSSQDQQQQHQHTRH